MATDARGPAPVGGHRDERPGEVFRGVLPLPASVLKGVGPFLVNPLTRRRAITLTLRPFKYGGTNALGEPQV